MEKYITDERTGLKYELVGDYYFIAGDDEPEERPIGIWGQRHLRYLKQHRRTVYAELLTSGKLNDYLADINEQAEDMFFRLVKELAEKDGINSVTVFSVFVIYGDIQMRLSKQFVLAVLFFVIHTFDFPFIIRYNIAEGGRDTMKTIIRHLVLDDFEYRLLVGCVNKARTMFIDEGKPIEDVSELLLKIIDAPTKKNKIRS